MKEMDEEKWELDYTLCRRNICQLIYGELAPVKAKIWRRK